MIAFAEAGKAQANLEREVSQPLLSRNYEPATGRAAGKPGEFVDHVLFAQYDHKWEDKSFLLYFAQWEENYHTIRKYYVVYKPEGDEIVSGQSRTVDALIAAASQYTNDLHDEVSVLEAFDFFFSSQCPKSSDEKC